MYFDRRLWALTRGLRLPYIGTTVTLAGAEVIAPTGNTNFSRSLLFFSEPLTHTDARRRSS